MPFQEKTDSHVLLVASDIPGFYELLCEQCGNTLIAKERGET